jgi:hypothetical protein
VAHLDADDALWAQACAAWVRPAEAPQDWRGPGVDAPLPEHVPGLLSHTARRRLLEVLTARAVAAHAAVWEEDASRTVSEEQPRLMVWSAHHEQIAPGTWRGAEVERTWGYRCEETHSNGELLRTRKGGSPSSQTARGASPEIWTRVVHDPDAPPPAWAPLVEMQWSEASETWIQVPQRYQADPHPRVWRDAWRVLLRVEPLEDLTYLQLWGALVEHAEALSPAVFDRIAHLIPERDLREPTRAGDQYAVPMGLKDAAEYAHRRCKPGDRDVGVDGLLTVRRPWMVWWDGAWVPRELIRDELKALAKLLRVLQRPDEVLREREVP